MWRRITGEPHSEVWVGSVRVKFLADFLQYGHPRDGKMTVLEHHPGAVLLSSLHHLDGYRSLALSEGEGAQLGTAKTLWGSDERGRKCILTELLTGVRVLVVYVGLWALRTGHTWSSANLRSAAIGSPPGDRTKMRGAQQWESAKALGRLKGGGSMYFLPSLATTKSCMAGTIFRKRERERECVHVHVRTYIMVSDSDTIKKLNLVWSEATEYNHLLKHAQLFPLLGKGVCVWVYTVIVLLPLLHHPTKGHTDTLESSQVGKVQ